MPRWPKNDVDVETPVIEKQTVKISDEDASVLSHLITAPINESEKARRAIQVWLEGLLQDSKVSGEQAKIVLHIIRQSSVSKLSGLCDQVLSKYLSNFEQSPA